MFLKKKKSIIIMIIIISRKAGGGGVSLACENFRRLFNIHSLPALFFLFF